MVTRFAVRILSELARQNFTVSSSTSCTKKSEDEKTRVRVDVGDPKWDEMHARLPSRNWNRSNSTGHVNLNDDQFNTRRNVDSSVDKQRHLWNWIFFHKKVSSRAEFREAEFWSNNSLQTFLNTSAHPRPPEIERSGHGFNLRVPKFAGREADVMLLDPSTKWMSFPRGSITPLMRQHRRSILFQAPRSLDPHIKT